MNALERRFYDALMRYGDDDPDEGMRLATEFDAEVVAQVARRVMRRRDNAWGIALGVVVVAALGGLAWYTPTKTVVETVTVVDYDPKQECLDALDRAGELFDLISQVTTRSGERDAAEDRTIDALHAMDWEAFQLAAGETFALNDQMIALVEQAEKVDLTTPAEACRG